MLTLDSCLKLFSDFGYVTLPTTAFCHPDNVPHGLFQKKSTTLTERTTVCLMLVLSTSSSITHDNALITKRKLNTVCY